MIDLLVQSRFNKRGEILGLESWGDRKKTRSKAEKALKKRGKGHRTNCSDWENRRKTQRKGGSQK